MTIEEMLEAIQMRLADEISDEDYAFYSGFELFYQQIIWQNSKKGERNGKNK